MLLWQGVSNGKRSDDEEEEGHSKGELSDHEKDDEEDDKEEEEEGHFKGAKKQRLDDIGGKTIYSYDSLLSHIFGEKSAATVFIDEEEGHSKGELSDHEEHDEEEEEEEGHFKGAKKQRLDDTGGKTTIYSYDSLLSHICSHCICRQSFL